ncbi:MAG: DUF4249 family protein [Bacteroidetes bacterium]|jgi:hypothetical protein|nr:DUF4249 family protein [Bacteroidota bacterium]
MKQQTGIYFILFSILLLSCEEQIEWKISNYEEKLVVEGLITNERKAHPVKLSKTVAGLNKTPEKVTQASVKLSFNENVLTLIQNPANSGIYLTDSNFVGVVGPDYELEIILEKDTFTAQTQMVPVSNLSPVQFSEINDGNYYQLEYEPESSPSFTEHFYKWQDIQNDSAPFNARQTYYSLNTIDFNRELAPETEKIYFPSGTIIIRKKYSLTTDHATYLRSVLLETEWKGGLFDAPAGLAKTNISGGAVGYFSAHAVTTDTTFIE